MQYSREESFRDEMTPFDLNIKLFWNVEACSRQLEIQTLN